VQAPDANRTRHARANDRLMELPEIAETCRMSDRFYQTTVRRIARRCSGDRLVGRVAGRARPARGRRSRVSALIAKLSRADDADPDPHRVRMPAAQVRVRPGAAPVGQCGERGGHLRSALATRHTACWTRTIPAPRTVCGFCDDHGVAGTRHPSRPCPGCHRQSRVPQLSPVLDTQPGRSRRSWACTPSTEPKLPGHTFASKASPDFEEHW
jgi:hypothetical protein